MSAIAGVVKLHQRSIQNLINASDITLTIRLPLPVNPSNVNPLYGDLSRERNKTGQQMGPYNCLWYDAFSVRSTSPAGSNIEAMLEKAPGQFRDATAFAQLWLADILIDPTDVMGQTWLDRAQEVISQGRLYRVMGYTKTGLSTAVPYIATVALKGGLGYDD